MDGKEREVLKGHHGPVHCVEYSPDGEMYASGSGKHQLRFFLFPIDGARRYLVSRGWSVYILRFHCTI